MAGQTVDGPLDRRFVTGDLRPASTICLVRDGAQGLEILMVRRTPNARFLGGAWAFPGGAIDAEDDGPLARSAVTSCDEESTRWRAAALRELVEETGIWLFESGVVVEKDRPTGEDVYRVAGSTGVKLDGSSIRYFANWITPAPLPVRFDTRFFAAPVVGEFNPSIDGEELVDAAWVAPSAAVERADDGSWVVAFPTRRILDSLGRFTGVEGLLADLDRGDLVPAIQPRISVANGAVEILVPGDRGFEEAAEGERDPNLLRTALRIAAEGGEVPAEFKVS